MSHVSGDSILIDEESILSSGKLSDKSSVRQSEEYIETVLTLPPDGGWGWIIVAVSFLCNFVVDGAIYTYGIFLQDIGESFNVPSTTVSIGTSLITGILFATGPVTSALVNRLGFQASGFLGGALSAGAFAICSEATKVDVFLSVYGVVGGFSFCLVYLPSIIAIGFYFERWRALATSIAVTGGSVGVMGFPIIMKDLMSGYSWRVKFQVLSGLCALTGILALLYRPLKPTRVLMTKDENIVQLLSAEAADSVGSFHLDERPGFFKRLYRRFHNITYPTHSRLYRDSTVVMMPIPAGPSISSVFITSVAEGSMTTFMRGATSRTEAHSDRLGTVYEDEVLGQEKCKYCRKICCNYKCFQWCCGTTTQNRPMYRDDIFYAGSLYTLPEYAQSKATHMSEAQSIQYTMSVTRIALRPGRKERIYCKCCPESVIRTLVTMMNFHLFKSPSFSCLALSGFFTVLGMYVPYIYIIRRADENNIDPKVSIYLFQAVGISNGLGRILSGVITTIPQAKPLIVSYISLTICGMSTIISYFMVDIYSQFIYNTVFGLTLACLHSLRTSILVDIVGLKNLTNSFGLMLLVNCVGAFGGMPIAAVIKQSTGSFNFTFIFAGCALTLSGVLLMPLKRIFDWEQKKRKS